MTRYRKQRREHCSGFSLLEIVMALFVAGIGIISVLGLLTVGLHQQRKALAATRAEQFARSFFDAFEVEREKMDWRDLQNMVIDLTPTNTLWHAETWNVPFADRSIIFYLNTASNPPMRNIKWYKTELDYNTINYRAFIGDVADNPRLMGLKLELWMREFVPLHLYDEPDYAFYYEIFFEGGQHADKFQ